MPVGHGPAARVDALMLYILTLTKNPDQDGPDRFGFQLCMLMARLWPYYINTFTLFHDFYTCCLRDHFHHGIQAGIGERSVVFDAG